MHTVLIHQAFATPKEPGGTRHFELGRHCVARGHRFTVVASSVSYLTGKSTGPADRSKGDETLEGVRILRSYTPASLHRSYLARALALLAFAASSVASARRAGRADLVMGTSPAPFQAVSAWLLAFVSRRPFLLEIRDLWPEFLIDIGELRNPLLIVAARATERFLYARATHLLVNSPAYRDYLLEKGVDSDRISLIPNGVDPGMFDPAASGERVRRELGLDGKYVVTYAGALGMANDIPTILEAAEKLRDEETIHFLLVGDGKERVRLEAMARDSGLRNVTFTGTRPKAEIPEFLAASDACVATLRNIPMFRTTYPNKVFDYMAAGRPVLLGIDGVIRRVVDDAGAGIFVSPGEPSKLVEAVRRLAQHPDQGREMGARGRSHVVRNFNRRVQAEKFVTLLERLAEPKSRGPRG